MALSVSQDRMATQVSIMMSAFIFVTRELYWPLEVEDLQHLAKSLHDSSSVITLLVTASQVTRQVFKLKMDFLQFWIVLSLKLQASQARLERIVNYVLLAHLPTSRVSRTTKLKSLKALIRVGSSHALLEWSVKLKAFSVMSGMSTCSPCFPGSYYSFYGNSSLLLWGHARRPGEKGRAPFQLATAATPATGGIRVRAVSQQKNAHSDELQEDSRHSAAYTRNRNTCIHLQIQYCFYLIWGWLGVL